MAPYDFSQAPSPPCFAFFTHKPGLPSYPLSLPRGPYILSRCICITGCGLHRGGVPKAQVGTPIQTLLCLLNLPGGMSISSYFLKRPSGSAMVLAHVLGPLSGLKEGRVVEHPGQHLVLQKQCPGRQEGAPATVMTSRKASTFSFRDGGCRHTSS